MSHIPQKPLGTGGGSVAIRGFLVQTLVALLDITQAAPPFTEITLEPALRDEQFDFIWKDKADAHAVQVKSTANIFEKSDVEKWAAKLEAAHTTEDCRLMLVGLIHPSLEKINQVGKVKIQKKNLDLSSLFDQAAHCVAKFIHAQQLDAGTPDEHELIAKALVTQLEHYSTKSETLTHEAFVNLLRQWVRNAPRQKLKLAPSRFFRGSNQGTDSLIGRDKEFADLDSAWNGTSKKNIITIVAWGGIGKTSLVAHWAAKKLAQANHSGIERYFDWSFYSQGTRRETDANGAAKAVSADLFLKEAFEFFGDLGPSASNAGAWQKGERLAHLIGQHRTLLILDGLEPLQDARTGELRDDGLRALLRGLAAHNPGLCLTTTRQHLPELAIWHQTTAPEWELPRLTDEAGATLLTKLGVNGTDVEKRDLSTRVKGHALTLTLLGNYLRKAHHGDIRRVDRVDFRKVNEKEQGGHAFRVIAAYERWFKKDNCLAELAILRMLGLFDRPASPDCLAALRAPPISGLTDSIASLKTDEWNEAVTHLIELNLVEEQSLEPRRIFGYSGEIAKKSMEANAQKRAFPLGKPRPFENRKPKIENSNFLDAHPLIRDFFAERLHETHSAAWKAGHSRLFEHLLASVPYWPEGLDGLQPLFQSITHGSKVGMQDVVWKEVFSARVQRGAKYLTINLGGFSAELATLSSFFNPPWSQVSSALSEPCRNAVLSTAASSLQAAGRLVEATNLARTRYGMYLELSKHQPLVLRGFGRIIRVIAPWANRQGADVSHFVKASKQEDFLVSGGDLFDASFAFGQQLRNRAKTSFPLRCFLPIYDAYLRFITSHALKPLARLWQDRAVCMAQQSALSLLCGEVSDGMHEAERAVVFADNSSVKLTQTYIYAALADAMHQAGNLGALSRFREAENIQGKENPAYPFLYSVDGFLYCDLLLGESERAAWKSHLGLSSVPQGQVQKQSSPVFRDISAAKELTTKSLREVQERAAQALRIAKENHWLSGIGLDNLNLGRVALYRALLEKSTLFHARHHLFAAVEGLHRAGEMPHVVRGLLSRSWLRLLMQDTNGACADLDEAWQIAERGPMKLFLADIHLYRARLFFRERPYPRKSPQDDLTAAERLINDCGYHRRDEELADAKNAILGQS